MKINTIFVFLFLFLSLKLYGNTVHVIVDYTMNKNRLDLIKEKYSDVISKKTDLDIIYIGKGITKEKLGRYEEFKVGCGFDECAEIVDFINENRYDFSCLIREFPKCSNLQDEYGISIITDLNKSQKKNLKKSDKILLIDLKGIEKQSLPSIIINANVNEVNAGEEVIFNAQISNTSLAGTLEWFENGIKVESRVLKYSTIPDQDIQVTCKWSFEECKVESNIAYIKVKRCELAIPFSLYFENSAIYSRNVKNPNKVYVYPRVLTEQELKSPNSKGLETVVSHPNVIRCEDVPVMKISSSQIRSIVNKGQSPEYLITEPVFKYMDEMNFYK